MRSALAGGRSHWNLLMATLKGEVRVFSGVLGTEGRALALAEN